LITPANGSASTRVGGTTVAPAAAHSPAFPLKVCRFLVKDLCARHGYAKADYHVDLVIGEHGLLDLVLKVFDVLHDGNLTTDTPYAHLWNLTFDGRTYRNGWRNPWFARGVTTTARKPTTSMNSTLAN